MPEVESTCKEPSRVLARNFILVVTVTAVSVHLWRTQAYTTQAASFNLSSRAPTQPSDDSVGDTYYISPSNLYVSVRCVDSDMRTYVQRRGLFVIPGGYLDWYGLGRHFHHGKNAATILT